LEKSARRRLASQFALFAISNENVIDELREMDLSAISEREAKAALRELQKRII
jgi:hypothetical protein